MAAQLGLKPNVDHSKVCPQQKNHEHFCSMAKAPQPTHHVHKDTQSVHARQEHVCM